MIKRLFLLLSAFVLCFVLASCEKESGDGALYSMQNAYYMGKLKDDDLKAIANYHNNASSSDEKMDDTIATKIKKAYINMSAHEAISDIADVNIIHYYGRYNNSYVVMLTDNMTEYLDVMRTETLAGVSFNYTNSNIIYVWTDERITQEEELKLQYLDKYLSIYSDATIADINIEKDFGQYEGTRIVIITNKYTEYLTQISKETILKYEFEYSTSNGALVYYEKNFYTLKDAYRNGLLSNDSLEKLIKKFPASSGAGTEINGDPIA